MPTVARIRSKLILLVGLWPSLMAQAEGPIYPGIHPKLSGGGGQTVSRGPSALFYNPANLIMTKFIEPQLDVSFAKISYTYTHTDAESFPDPVVVDVTTPLATAGIAMRPVPAFTVGVAILPTGDGKERVIEGVPVEIVKGTYQEVDLSTSLSGQKIAAGAAVRFAFPIAIGAGVIISSEKNALIVSNDAQELPVIDALYSGSFNQFIGGLRSELIDRHLVIGLSYKTAVTKKYEGDIAYAFGDDVGDYEPFTGVGYTPSAIGFGLETRFGDSFAMFVDYVMEQWSAGRTVFKRGIGAEAPEKDFLDTHNISAGMKLWVAPKHMLELAGGYSTANVGDGTRASEDEGATLQDEDAAANPRADDIAGIGFGDFEGISRIVASGGYRAKIQGHGYFMLGGMYQTGSREVETGLDGEGKYDFSMISATLGLSVGF